ncbi:MAG: excinuclease ABC subunit UvrA, partial [Candidatus Latescibacterota bacterium]
WRLHLYEGAARHLGFELKTPWKKLSEPQRQGFLYGLGEEKIEFRYTNNKGYTWSHRDRYQGVVTFLEERYREGSERIRQDLNQYMGSRPCPVCGGGRLRPEALAVTLAGLSLPQVTGMPVAQSHRFFQELRLDPVRQRIAEEPLKEIRGRLQLLVDIGLDYLTLDRGAHTLSGGEAQRIRLASQIGSGLVGVVYVLDEPSIGLHHRDNQRLLDTLKRLRDLGNTVIVVEHDEETIRQADLVVDFGPGAGERGGQLVVAGTPEEVAARPESQTGQYLAGTCAIPIPGQRRRGNGKWLEIVGARHHNLRDISVRIPLGLFTCVTGVSGSGKSSLVNDILFKALDRQLHRAQVEPGDHDRIVGVGQLDKVIRIDQKPIGRTPRSNPATYTDLFTPIRQLFARVPEARLRGYKQGRFSFNVKGGRCEACEGNGARLVEMEFLADIWVTCEVCEGRRFNRETLTVRYKDRSIADVLDMEVEEALELFANVPAIRRVVQTLNDVGLGYIKLGQPAPTLSGGEAQRVKLAKELCRKSTGRTLYLLDEPTTGLHFADVDKLLRILHTFADQGNTVVVIEHNMEVIKTADYVLDMGPEGGQDGGLIVACGTPEEVAQQRDSHTGRILAQVLSPRARRPAAPDRRAVAAGGDGHIRQIEVVGARMHNLQGIDVLIPRDQVTVISGVSGSGKSSLAFDTVYAEGQRRYVESLSAYARQFLDQMEKPKVERVTGLSPAIAIEQKAPSRNPRSTVGTVTEVYDYIRALFATIGVQHCPVCQVPVGGQTPDQMVDRLLQQPEGRRVVLLAPVEPRGSEGYEPLLRRAQADGFLRVRVDGQLHDLREEIHLERRHRHRIELVVDRLVIRASQRPRLREGVERALELAAGLLIVLFPEDDTQTRMSRHLSCPECGRTFDPLVPQSFSFNHREGWCPECEGLGESEGLDRDLVVADRNLSVRGGAIALWGPVTEPDFAALLEIAGQALGFDLDTPFGALSPDGRRALLYGAADRTLRRPDGLSFRYRGLLPPVDDLARGSARSRRQLRTVTCSVCEGSRLRADSRAVRLRGRSIVDLVRMPLSRSRAFFDALELDAREAEMTGELLPEIRTRLRFLDQVGLGYVDLARRTSTLSGGEAQRIRLASQIGSGLTGVLYLLDEPTIGLHPRDNRRLLEALARLRELGNTVVLVEHDRETLEQADHIIDLGPGAGAEGGRVVATGSPGQLRRVEGSQTGAYLAGRLCIPVPGQRRPGNGLALVVRQAAENNLKGIDVTFPLGKLICVTGVSGSGKSTLVQDILQRALSLHLLGQGDTPGEHAALEGVGHIDKVIDIDQTPIGHSPRSTPATVMGAFDLIRQLYAEMPEAKVRGFNAGHFSFNRAGGRCGACEGLGWKCIEMHFLPDVWVQCDTCRGQRFNQDVLRVRFRGHSIAQVLDMPVRGALQVFASVPRIHRLLQTLDDVGLGYMSLGQSSTTLSGGEAQRLKLASELSRPSTGRTLYLLDEPTTGLHAADVERLVVVLHRLVDAGNTMVVVEHNMDIVKTADHVIDLGPEGGAEGGRIVAQGTPEEVAQVEASHTGRFLRQVLAGQPWRPI